MVRKSFTAAYVLLAAGAAACLVMFKASRADLTPRGWAVGLLAVLAVGLVVGVAVYRVTEPGQTAVAIAPNRLAADPASHIVVAELQAYGVDAPDDQERAWQALADMATAGYRSHA